MDWRALLPLFAKVVPVRAESLFHLDGIEYLALCEEFEEIGMEETVPMYDVTYRTVEEGREVFIFTRAGRAIAVGEEHPTSKSGLDRHIQHSGDIAGTNAAAVDQKPETRNQKPASGERRPE